MTSISYRDLIHSSKRALSIPTFSGAETSLECAYAYQDCGWWIVPIKPGTKNPGSILGVGWQFLSSNQTSQADLWFENHPDRGIALHMGPSGGLAVDVDDPGKISDALGVALRISSSPFQSTRSNHEGRGHYVFSVPFGQSYSNSNGSLGKAWGEVRAGNGVIMVQPSQHPEAANGAHYQWLSSGELPILPFEISSRLNSSRTTNSGSSVLALNDVELEAFVALLAVAKVPELLPMRVEEYLPKFRRGSRHNALKLFLLFGFRDARAGLFSALAMLDAALKLFLCFKPKEEWSSPNEFWDLVRWTASASKTFSEEQLLEALELGRALASPGVAKWIKAVSNVTTN